MGKQYEITAAECSRLRPFEGTTRRVTVKTIDGGTVRGQVAELEQQITLPEPRAGAPVDAPFPRTYAYLVTLT